MKTVKGDLLQYAKEGKFDLIVHGCNCYCTMGAGIAKTIKQEFPPAYQADLATEKGDKGKLGSFSWAKVANENGDLIIVNAYTQFDWHGSGLKADYQAIRKAFKQIKSDFSGLRMGYPAIGAGLAGGDWKIISTIISEELQEEDHTFVEYQK